MTSSLARLQYLLDTLEREEDVVARWILALFGVVVTVAETVRGSGVKPFRHTFQMKRDKRER